MNRHNHFFKRHELNAKQVDTEDLATRLYNEHMGFNRVRRSLKENVMKILRNVIEKQKQFKYSYYLAKNAPLPANWKERKI
jgi:hypothetical protein